MGLTKISGGVIQSDNFSVGVITATSLQIGSATTIHTTGIDLGSGNVTSHNINSTGIITAASFGAINGTTASFSGDVSVGGVLTYDDVTNIDSIGVVTARSGIHVTGVGASVGIGTDNPAKKLEILHLESRRHQFSFDDNFLTIKGANQNGNPETLRFIGGDSLRFHTGSTGSGTEKFRITSDGNVGIGSSVPQYALDISDGASSGIRLGVGTHAYRVRANVSDSNDFGFFIEDEEGTDLYNVRGPHATSNANTHRFFNDGTEVVSIGSTAVEVTGKLRKTEYEPGEIIERICSVCDGSTHVVKSGSYTMANVTAEQAASTSDAVCSGSSIDYKCPAGAKRIHYEYWFKWEATERSGISHFFIEVDGFDVVPSRRTFANNFSRYSTTYYHHGEGWYCMNWVFECDAASTDTSEGQYDSWASSEQTKTIRTVFREYNGSYEISLHGNNYWDGATASGVNQKPIKPMLIITTTA